MDFFQAQISSHCANLIRLANFLKSEERNQTKSQCKYHTVYWMIKEGNYKVTLHSTRTFKGCNKSLICFVSYNGPHKCYP